MAEQHVVIELALGKLTVQGEVLSTTVTKALNKVEGVRPHRKAGGVMAIFGGGEDSVQLDVQGDTVNVEVRIGVILGYPVQEVSLAIQEVIRGELEQLGIAKVGTVNVAIKRLIPPDEEPQSKEEEKRDA